MLKPSANIVDCPYSSRYALVVAVAKRAREIAQEAEDAHQVLIQKPVELAVRDFVEHRCTIVEPDPDALEEEEDMVQEPEEAAAEAGEEASVEAPEEPAE